MNTSASSPRRGLIRNKIAYVFFYVTLYIVIRVTRHFTYTYAKTKTAPALVLANHNSDWDPLMLVVGLRRHMKFVASANILSGFTGGIIRFLVNPIPRPKGASAEETVALIEENLRAGISVAMFPEGNKSWDGTTGYISPRTARLVKDAGCGLILYRFDGDYLQTPRWARFRRRGRVTGRVIGEYTPAELAGMSPEDIYDLIVAGLAANAFDAQRQKPCRYRGKRKAEGFETLAYLCPSCRRFGSIVTRGDEITCACGLHLTYTDYGFLEGTPGAPGDACQWNAFQREYLAQNIESLSAQTAAPLCTDRGCLLSIRTPDGAEQSLPHTDVYTYGDRLEFHVPGREPLSVPWTGISKMGMFRNTSVYLTCGLGRVTVKRDAGLSGIRYFSLWRVFCGKPLF